MTSATDTSTEEQQDSFDLDDNEQRWANFVGFFLDRKLIVLVLVLLLIGAGLYVAPFDWDLGDFPRDRVPVDAIPDIGENQQIVFTEWPGRSPRDIEDQITYPLTTALLGIPGVRTVRSFSMMGFSTIYVIFEDGVEFYWSRSRVLEKLSSLPAGTVPDSVAPRLGPDATALGQVFWYTLEGRDRDGEVTGGWDMQELRSIQDWTVRYALQSVPGVSEVASVGGYVREYQVDVDPEAMQAHGVRLEQVAAAVRGSNLDVGARTMEINRAEYVLRGLGFVENVEDLEQAVVTVREHVPIRVGDVAQVGLGPANRRGALDVSGAEAVGGVVVVRYGENPLEVIERVHAKIREIAPGLPRRILDDGTVSQVTIVPFYDRTGLINETLGTLSTALIQQILITIIVVLIMLRALSTSTLITSLLPLAVLSTFIAMKVTGVDANIMSLAGIAIAIGTMVDMGIVLTENVVARLDDAPPGMPRTQVVRQAAAEVAPAVMTSVATTVVSFLPVFALTGSEGKLFRPLAFTKSYALIASLALAVIVLPTAAHLILRKRPAPIERDEASWKRVLRSLLRPAHLRDWALVAAGVAVAVWFSPVGGMLVALLAVLDLIAPLLPGEKLSAIPGWLKVIVAVAAVTALLTWDWMPLGPRAGLALNLLFVAGLIGSLLGVFLVFQRIYPPLLERALEHKLVTLSVPALLVLFGLTAWLGFDRVFAWVPSSVRHAEPMASIAEALPGFGREFMPPFDEGSYLYMPTTMPHASFGQALAMIQRMDAAIAAIPEVEQVVGKLGRADSPLDPAPVSMFETVIIYRPEWGIDEEGQRVRQWRDHIQSPDDIWDEIVEAAQMPGLTSAPVLQPISARIVMLQSGMRAPMGLKIRGPDLETIEDVGLQIESLLKQVTSIRSETVFADRVVGKPYIELEIDRQAIARHGLTIDEVQRVIQIALGGRTLTRTVEGRERYPVRVRYMREERDSVEALGRVRVPIPPGASGEQHQIPLSELTSISYARGPQAIRAEDTFLTSYVLFDRDPDVSEVEVVEQAQAFLEQAIDRGDLELPSGVSYSFAGSYQNQLRSERRLSILVPLALVLILMLLYLQFRRGITTLIIYSGVIVAISGGFLLVWLYNQPWFMAFDLFGVSMRDLFQVGTVNMSVAVWVGFIALLGIATDDGVVLATYIHQRLSRAKGKLTTKDAIRDEVVEAGRRRVRPALMTTATTILALLPVVTSQGRGADLMVPMAIPALGGMAIEVVTLFVVPLLYSAVEELKVGRIARMTGLETKAESSSGSDAQLELFDRKE